MTQAELPSPTTWAHCAGLASDDRGRRAVTRHLSSTGRGGEGCGRPAGELHEAYQKRTDSESDLQTTLWLVLDLCQEKSEAGGRGDSARSSPASEDESLTRQNSEVTELTKGLIGALCMIEEEDEEA